MKVRYPAKVKRRRNHERQGLSDPCWKTECVLAKNQSQELASDEAIKEFGPIDSPGTIEFQDDHDEHCTQCGGRSHFWSEGE